MQNKNFKNDKRKEPNGWYVTKSGKEEPLLERFPQELEIKELHIAEGVYRVVMNNIPDMELFLPNSLSSIALHNCGIKEVTLPKDTYYVTIPTNTTITNLNEVANNKNISIKIYKNVDEPTLRQESRVVEVFHIAI